jgi:hypothetical protein
MPDWLTIPAAALYIAAAHPEIPAASILPALLTALAAGHLAYRVRGGFEIARHDIDRLWPFPTDASIRAVTQVRTAFSAVTQVRLKRGPRRGPRAKIDWGQVIRLAGNYAKTLDPEHPSLVAAVERLLRRNHPELIAGVQPDTVERRIRPTVLAKK